VWAFVVRRLLTSIPVLVAIVTIAFAATFAVPADPVAMLVGEDATSAQYGRIRQELGLDRPAQGVNDGKGFCFVSHTGDVCPSGFLPLAAGNVRQQTVSDIYRHAPLFTDLRQPDKLKGRCGRCRFRQVCGGSRARAYALTGDYLAADPSCVYVPGKDG